MGSIVETVEVKLKEALKSKDARGTSVFRMLKASLVNERIAKMNDLSEAEEIAVVRRELKKRQDSIQAFKDGGRSDRAAEEEAEAAILKELLPPELSDEQIKEIVRTVMASAGADNFGKVMGQVMKEVGSGASGDRVNSIVKAEISNK